jgi:hypothetical protein
LLTRQHWYCLPVISDIDYFFDFIRAITHFDYSFEWLLYATSRERRAQGCQGRRVFLRRLFTLD